MRDRTWVKTMCNPLWYFRVCSTPYRGHWLFYAPSVSTPSSHCVDRRPTLDRIYDHAWRLRARPELYFGLSHVHHKWVSTAPPRPAAHPHLNLLLRHTSVRHRLLSRLWTLCSTASSSSKHVFREPALAATPTSNPENNEPSPATLMIKFRITTTRTKRYADLATIHLHALSHIWSQWCASTSSTTTIQRIAFGVATFQTMVPPPEASSRFRKLKPTNITGQH